MAYGIPIHDVRNVFSTPQPVAGPNPDPPTRWGQNGEAASETPTWDRRAPARQPLLVLQPHLSFWGAERRRISL